MTSWRQPDRPLVLASCSPRRSQILRQLGLSFEVVPPRIHDEESFLRGDDIEDSVKELAAAKAQEVALRRPDALVLGADTIVVADGRILGKPTGNDDARAMLRALSGRTHQVCSGVALLCGSANFRAAGVACTRVVFRALHSQEINEYIDTKEHVDKAGAYGIQGAAAAFVERIEGCYYNVVGLPVSATLTLLANYSDRKDTAHVGTH
jgi:septum formation protein